MATLASPSHTVSLITFAIGAHTCAVATDRVQEILRMVALNPLSGSPEWVAGLMNMRGAPVVVVDLRLRLACAPATIALATPIIVANTTSGRTVGLIADAINDLHSVPADDVFASNAGGFVHAVARVGQHLVNVLDVDALTDGVNWVDAG